MYKQTTTRFTNWIYATIATHGVHLSTNVTVNLKNLQERRDKPNVVECNDGKFTSPFHGDTDSIKCGQDLVAKTLPAGEAIVGTFPDAVDAVCAIRFSEDVVKLNCLKN